jgi:hypothetical protein
MTDLFTTPESDSEASGERPLGRFVGALCGGVVYWMPVWVSLGLLALLGLRGLKPALIEDDRLRQAETRLATRVAGLRADRDGLERELSALSDPIYIERLRRLRDEE